MNPIGNNQKNATLEMKLIADSGYRSHEKNIRISAEQWGYIQEIVHQDCTINNWLDVSEKLPPSHIAVLVVKNNLVLTDVFYDGKNFIKSINAAEDRYIDGVTHWQKLPEPPQVSEKTGE